MSWPTNCPAGIGDCCQTSSRSDESKRSQTPVRLRSEQTRNSPPAEKSRNATYAFTFSATTLLILKYSNRPLLLLTRALCDQPGRREALHRRHNLHLPTPAHHFLRADDRIHVVVAALHDHVRPRGDDQLQRSLLPEYHHRIDSGQSGQHPRALRL